MSRRLPAGNGVVGHDGRDDPGRALGGGALAGVHGRVRLGALHGPADGVVVEPAAPRPILVRLGEHGAHHPDERLPAREDPHHAAAALELAVDARAALDQVLGEAAPRAQLRDPGVDGARAGGEPALAVSVPLVAGLAGLVGPGVHDLVDQGFGHYPQQLGEVDHAVVESGYLGPVARDLVYIVHMRLLPFYES